MEKYSKEKFCGLLIHLSFNIWGDRLMSETGKMNDYHDYVWVDEEVWDEIIKEAAQNGINTILVGMGDAVKYKSHPEIAVKDAWSVEKLKEKLDEIRALGMTPIPQVNFSNAHNAWMGKYKRMISTPEYYAFCKDIIDEVCEIFDNPPIFDIGMDEEGDFCQSWFDFCCIRRGKLLWHDVNYILDCVRKNGATPWIAADLFWAYPEEFSANIAKDVIVSPWYYLSIEAGPPPYNFHEDWHDSPSTFKKISDAGYREITIGGNFNWSENMKELVAFSKEQIPDNMLLGYLLTIWKPPIDKYKYTYLEGIRFTKYALEGK